VWPSLVRCFVPLFWARIAEDLEAVNTQVVFVMVDGKFKIPSLASCKPIKKHTQLTIANRQAQKPEEETLPQQLKKKARSAK
jgi:hypothetical protein